MRVKRSIWDWRCRVWAGGAAVAAVAVVVAVVGVRGCGCGWEVVGDVVVAVADVIVGGLVLEEGRDFR